MSPEDDGNYATPVYMEWLKGSASSASGSASGSSSGSGHDASSACHPGAAGAHPLGGGRGKGFVAAVPLAHRLPHRWGWKNPKTM
jgi:hypothetical protein